MNETGIDSPSSLYHPMLWDVRRSIRYHTRRRAFFERFNTFSNATAVFFGSATILAILTHLSQDAQPFWWPIIPAAGVTLFSTINLVVDTVQKAQRHHDLARRFMELEKALVQADQASPSLLRDLKAKRLEIEADEPPIHRIVDILCHNELMRADGYDPNNYSDHYYKVGVFRRFFAPFFDLAPDGVKPNSPPKSIAG